MYVAQQEMTGADTKPLEIAGVSVWDAAEEGETEAS